MELGLSQIREMLPLRHHRGTAFQAHRMFGRSKEAHRMFGRIRETLPTVWSKEAPEAGAGRSYQFVVKVIFISERLGGYRASFFLRVTAWSSGASRRGNSRPKLPMRLGDPFGTTNVRTSSYDQLSTRSWWPATEDEWPMAKPYSFWDIADVGVTTNAWSGFPQLSVTKLQPHLFPLGNTEIVADCQASSRRQL